MKLTLAIVFSLLFLAWVGSRAVNEVVFDRNCEGYLKRAADANTIELAEKNLAVAVKYLEDNKLTTGYTSILWRTPDEDVGFWHDNLTASINELHAVKPDATQLERTNVLIKLRETLLDVGGGVSVTFPSGMSLYPDNSFYAIWGLLSFIFAAIFWIAHGVDSGY